MGRKSRGWEGRVEVGWEGWRLSERDGSWVGKVEIG